jgi:hypothetical protein
MSEQLLLRENLVRALSAGPELRDAGDGMPTMFGHFAVFDSWTTIDSRLEGRFRERLGAGAFAKTIAENRGRIVSLFNHGKDPAIGEKLLGPIEELREDPEGPYSEVPLLDTSYNRDLVPGLRAGLYGASFRFRVTRDEIVRPRAATEDNPDKLPERTIREVQLHEFGPVTFPAYPGATVAVRSMTDEYTLSAFLTDPDRLAELVRHIAPATPASDAGAVPHLATARREPAVSTPRFKTREEYLNWIRSI